MKEFIKRANVRVVLSFIWIILFILIVIFVTYQNSKKVTTVNNQISGEKVLLSPTTQTPTPGITNNPFISPTVTATLSTRIFAQKPDYSNMQSQSWNDGKFVFKLPKQESYVPVIKDLEYMEGDPDQWSFRVLSKSEPEVITKDPKITSSKQYLELIYSQQRMADTNGPSEIRGHGIPTFVHIYSTEDARSLAELKTLISQNYKKLYDADKQMGGEMIYSVDSVNKWQRETLLIDVNYGGDAAEKYYVVATGKRVYFIYISGIDASNTEHMQVLNTFNFVE